MAFFSSKRPNGARRLFRLPLTRRRMLADLDDEMQFHVDMRVAELRALGRTEAEARAEALRRFGDADEFLSYGAARAARRVRMHRVMSWLDEWSQDLRLARRQFIRAPGFTAIAILTLALGIGANTAIFSVVHRLLLAPLPYPNGNRIVMPMAEDQRGLRTTIAGPVLAAWRARTHTVDAFAAVSTDWFSVRDDGTVEYMSSASVTASFLGVLGVQPVLGRTFTTDEERDGSAAVAMISHGLWQRQYGGRSDVIGATVAHDNKSYKIIGVTPPGLALPMSQDAPPDIWVPMHMDPSAPFGGSVGSVLARLRPGASAEEATKELQASVESVPNGNANHLRARAMRAQDFLDARESLMVQVLFVAVGALLLIACANVANLLLARALTRRREFAVRIALGASRWRLARQVLTESVSLALLGGLAGLVVAAVTLKIIVALRPPSLPQLADVRIEPVVLLWSAAISVATGILFGCAPALFAGARVVGGTLRTEARGASSGATARRVRSALIVVEIATSLVLLVGAGLLVRSFRELQRMPLGFEPRGLVYENAIVGIKNRERRAVIRDAIVARLRALPGVTGVAIGTMPGKGFMGGGLESEPDTTGQSVRVQGLSATFMTPDYFRVIGMKLLEGRLPDTASLTEAWKNSRPFDLAPEVVVNRSLARRLWPNGDAVGSRVRRPPDNARPAGGATAQPWSTVVGVVGDFRMWGLNSELRTLQVYTQNHPKIGDIGFVIRMSAPNASATRTIERAVQDVDASIVVRPALSGDAYLRDSLAPMRFAMALLTAFASIALVLAAVGLYGVISYTVSQRTREIGIRVALGAQRDAVVRLVVSGALALAAGGVVLGTLAAVASTRLLRGLLYAVSPSDPLTFTAIAFLVAAIAVLASYVPARRALRIDPVEALRAD
jgi:predicted permease